MVTDFSEEHPSRLFFEKGGNICLRNARTAWHSGWATDYSDWGGGLPQPLLGQFRNSASVKANTASFRLLSDSLPTRRTIRRHVV
jgi:hypothetical protein